MRMRTPLTRRFIAALLMVLLTACHSWRPTTVSPQGWTPEEQPSSVRVTRTSGEVMIVRDPIIRNGSILGSSDAGVAAVALGDVRLLEVRRFHRGQTIGLGAAIGGIAGGTAGWVVWEVASELFCPDLFGGTSTCTTPVSLSQSVLIGALAGGAIGALIGGRSSGESERSWTAMPYVGSSSQLGLRTRWSIPWPGP